MLAAGKFDEAIDIYRELNEQEMVEEAIYQKAAALNQPGLYMDILDYKDSRELHYLAGKALLESEPDKAYAILTDDISYSDIPLVLYGLAEQESKKENYQLSSLIFGRLATLPLDPENPKADCRMRALQDMYQYGLQLQAKGEWETAASTFDLIAGLGQAQTHSNEAYYEIAAAMEENGRYAQAAVAFEALGEFSNSSERAKQNRYNEAKRQLEAEAFDEAETGFLALGNFSDAPQMVKECKYQAAGNLFASRMYAEARKIYVELGDYASSAEKKDECTYLLAEGYQKGEEYDMAIAEYETILEYKDATAKWSECHQAIAENAVNSAETLLRGGKTEKAIEAYKVAYDEYVIIGNAEKADTLALRVAECYQSGNDLNEALEWFLTARKNNEAIPRMESIAAYCVLTEQKQSEVYVLQTVLLAKAENALDAGDYKAAVEYYDQIDNAAIEKTREEEANYYYGAELLMAGEYEKAVKEFTKAGSYSDAADRIIEAWLDYGDELLTGKAYEEARVAFANAGSDEKVIEAWNLEAEEYLEAKQYEKAREAFAGAGNEEKIKEAWNLEGEAYLADKQYEKAREAFAGAGNEEKIKEAWNLEAEEYIVDKQYEQARDAFTNAGEDDRIIEAWNLEAEDYLAEAQFENAKNAFEKAGNTTRYEDTIFEEANALMNAGQFEQSYQLFSSIISRNGVREIIDSHPEFIVYKMKIGDIITFGAYEQDNNDENGKEPIEWVVLSIDEEKVLLLSKIGLDIKPEEESKKKKQTKELHWDNSRIRAWLNDEFLNSAFSATEQDRILLTEVDNGRKQGYMGLLSNGENTEDKVFLLSYKEFHDYVEDDLKVCVPSAYAQARGEASGQFRKFWGLRTKYDKFNFEEIDSKGSISHLNGGKVTLVRPAIYVKLY